VYFLRDTLRELTHASVNLQILQRELTHVSKYAKKNRIYLNGNINVNNINGNVNSQQLHNT